MIDKSLKIGPNICDAISPIDIEAGYWDLNITADQLKKIYK